MKRRLVRFVGIGVVGACALALQSSHATRALNMIARRGATAATPGARPAAITQHIVIISMDGLRPDAIDRFGAATIQRMMRHGSYTLQAQTVEPSRTLPAHASMLAGVEPPIHGITWNHHAPGNMILPTVFDLATEAGLTSAAFFSKAKLSQLTGPGDVDHLKVRSRWSLRQWDAEHTFAEVIEYLEDGNRPNLLFVHVAEPDQTGHEHGWMSEEYGEAVLETDRELAELLATADHAFGSGQYTVILTADHGGVGHGHRTSDPRSTRIPWVTWGKGVTCGKRVKQAVRTTDTAATVAWLLRLDVPRQWSGRPVKSAYNEKLPRSGDPVLNRLKRATPLCGQ